MSFLPAISPFNKKSSVQISLLILGGLAVSGCDRQTRYEYAHRDDCIKDWGETECNQHSSTSNSGGSGGSRYYYYRNDNATPRAGSRVHSVIRGGFGRSGGGGS